MKVFGTLALLLLSLGAHAYELPSCAPPSGLSIGGVSLSDTHTSIAAKLGKPKRTGTYQGEDDGGIYTGSTLFYPQLELDVDKLRGIERIASANPGTTLPYGLKVGMPLQRAATLLHFVPIGLGDNDVAVLPICETDVDAEMRIHFAGGALKSVEIVQYGP